MRVCDNKLRLCVCARARMCVTETISSDELMLSNSHVNRR